MVQNGGKEDEDEEEVMSGKEMEKDTWNIFSRVANRLGSMPSNLVSGTKFNRIREKGELERAWKETVLDASEASL